MSRPIKFRAWLPNIKKMTHSFGLFTVPDGIADVEMPIIMQFTGLTDKNGKEIWEGDVVRCLSKREVEEGRQPFTITVKVDYERGSFFAGPHTLYDLLTIRPYIEIEVLGNIYEHPSLLTQPEKVKL